MENIGCFVEQVLSIYLPMWDVELWRRGTGGSGRSRGDGLMAPPYRLDQGRYGVRTAGKQPRLILAKSDGRQEVVVRCCGECLRLGVRWGMSVAEARAMCGENVRVVAFERERSVHGMHVLAKWAVRYSPRVWVEQVTREEEREAVGGGAGGPDGVMLDVTGAAHLFGGEQMMLVEVATRLRRMGFYGTGGDRPDRGGGVGRGAVWGGGVDGGARGATGGGAGRVASAGAAIAGLRD